MAITFVCPCGKHLRARDEQAGLCILCPACGTPVTISALDADVPDSEAHESNTGDDRGAIYRPEPGNEPAPVRHAEVPCPDLGPIFFRFRPSRGNPNGDFGGKWVPLDDTAKPPPDERPASGRGGHGGKSPGAAKRPGSSVCFILSAPGRCWLAWGPAWG